MEREARAFSARSVGWASGALAPSSSFSLGVSQLCLNTPGVQIPNPACPSLSIPLCKMGIAADVWAPGCGEDE